MKSGPENQFCTGEGPPVPSSASSLRGDEGGEDEEEESGGSAHESPAKKAKLS